MHSNVTTVDGLTTDSNKNGSTAATKLQNTPYIPFGPGPRPLRNHFYLNNSYVHKKAKKEQNETPIKKKKSVKFDSIQIKQIECYKSTLTVAEKSLY
jgi:hypothetical protein